MRKKIFLPLIFVVFFSLTYFFLSFFTSKKIKIASDIPEYNITFTKHGKKEIDNYLQDNHFWEKERIFRLDKEKQQPSFITAKKITFLLTEEFQTGVRTGRKPIDMGVDFSAGENGEVDILIDVKHEDIKNRKDIVERVFGAMTVAGPYLALRPYQTEVLGKENLPVVPRDIYFKLMSSESKKLVEIEKKKSFFSNLFKKLKPKKVLAYCEGYCPTTGTYTTSCDNASLNPPCGYTSPGACYDVIAPCYWVEPEPDPTPTPEEGGCGQNCNPPQSGGVCCDEDACVGFKCHSCGAGKACCSSCGGGGGGGPSDPCDVVIDIPVDNAELGTAKPTVEWRNIDGYAGRFKIWIEDENGNLLSSSEADPRSYRVEGKGDGWIDDVDICNHPASGLEGCPGLTEPGQPCYCSWTFMNDIVDGNDYVIKVRGHGGASGRICTDSSSSISVNTNDPPFCESYSISPSSAISNNENTPSVGDTIAITAQGQDNETFVNRIDMSYIKKEEGKNYCGGGWDSVSVYPANCSFIGSKRTCVGYLGTEDLTGGEYYTAANIWDSEGMWCTGNPDGACGVADSSCSSCNDVIYLRPPSPTGLEGECVCNNVNDVCSVDLNWNNIAGAQKYPLRVDKDPASNTWNPEWPCNPYPGDVCNDNIVSNSYSFLGNPGAEYNWWVHAEIDGIWSNPPADGSNFRCSYPPETELLGIEHDLSGSMNWNPDNNPDNPGLDQNNPNRVSVRFSDKDGYQDLKNVKISIGTAGSHAIRYNQNEERFYFAGGSCTSGESWKTLSDGQITLNCAVSSVSFSGSNLTVDWGIQFEDAFGSQTGVGFYFYAEDKEGLETGWVST